MFKCVTQGEVRTILVAPRNQHKQAPETGISRNHSHGITGEYYNIKPRQICAKDTAALPGQTKQLSADVT